MFSLVSTVDHELVGFLLAAQFHLGFAGILLLIGRPASCSVRKDVVLAILIFILGLSTALLIVALPLALWEASQKQGGGVWCRLLYRQVPQFNY